MPGRNISVGWPAAMGALSLLACSGVAMAQGAPPPPAVSVTPVASRQVTETGEFIGRVTAINKVDIVARVAGLHRGAQFHRRAAGQEGRPPVPASNRRPTRRRSSSSAPISPRPRRQRSTPRCNWSAARSSSAIRTSRNPRSTSAPPTRRQRKPSVMQAQALLDQAQINLGYTEIRSPIDGRIGLADFTVGNLVSPRPGSLRRSSARIPSTSSFRPASAMFSTTGAGSPNRRQEPACDHSHQAAQRQHLSASRPQQLPRRPGRSHDGHGGGAGASAEPGRSSDPRRRRRRHGGTGRAAIGADWFRNPPSSSIRPAAMSCWSTRRRRSSCGAITTGVEQGRDIVVTDGLKEGELVIVEGIQKVRPGQVVTASVVPGN